jgi:hypothetical protein
MRDRSMPEHARLPDTKDADPAEELHSYEESDLAEDFDPTLYPRTYRMSLGWRLLILTWGVLLTLGGLFGVAYFSLDGTLTGWAAVFLITLCAVFACLGLYGVLHPLQYRVTLAADAVEAVEPFHRRRLSRSDIKGQRLLRPGKGFSVLALVPRDEHVKQLHISLVLKTDGAFALWFSEFPDLDAQEVIESHVELIHRLYPDLSPEERAWRMKRLQHLATGVNGAAIAFCAAGFLLPDPDHLVFAALVALPWVAIGTVARFQPLCRFGGRSTDRHLDLTLPLILPGFILTLRAVSEVETLDLKGPAMLAFAGGLLLTGAVARVDPWFQKQRWVVLVAGLITCLYGYGAGLELNALADGSAPRVYPVVVAAKHVSEDSKSTTWYLTLNPWGPVTESKDVSVSAARYRLTGPGDTVCVMLRPGAFRIAWYRVSACTEAQSATGVAISLSHRERLLCDPIAAAAPGTGISPSQR